MFRKILLLFRLSLPYVLNTLLVIYMYSINEGKEFALTDSLFYTGMLSFIYGIGTIFIFPRSTYLYRHTARNSGINLALSDQHIKRHHANKKKFLPNINFTTQHIKLLYIIIGILLCVSSGIVYFI